MITGGRVLTEAHEAQLGGIISRWRRENPQFRSVAYIRFNSRAPRQADWRPREGGGGTRRGARELNTLTERADTVLPVMRQATDEMAARTERILNHLFLELLLLILAAIAASLLAALVYRAVVSRMQRHDTPVRTAR